VPPGGVQLLAKLHHRRQAGDRPVRDGAADAGQVLHHDPAGANIQVADLGIAHLALGQPDIRAAGAQEGAGAGGPEAVEDGGDRLGHGVVRLVFPPTPAIQDDEHDGLRTGHGQPQADWLRAA
jgi:hypothetical protein